MKSQREIKLKWREIDLWYQFSKGIICNDWQDHQKVRISNDIEMISRSTRFMGITSYLWHQAYIAWLCLAWTLLMVIVLKLIIHCSVSPCQALQFSMSDSKSTLMYTWYEIKEELAKWLQHWIQYLVFKN